MKLVVGNGSIESFDFCQKQFGSCELLESTTKVDYNKNYHTSIHDVFPNYLDALIKQADEVLIGPLNDDDLTTRTLLANNKKIIIPDVFSEPLYLNDNDMLFLGCSHTTGVGLTVEERFSTLVANSFNLNPINLGKPGSSIAYSTNLFHRCNFKRNQKVVLQITHAERTDILTKDFKYKTLDMANKEDTKMLSAVADEILLATAFASISGVIYTARKLNVNLVCFMLSGSPLATKLYYLLSSFKEFIPLYDYSLDKARDNGHFGSRTHQLLANKIVDVFKKG